MKNETIRILMVVLCILALNFIINSFSECDRVIMDKLVGLGIVGLVLWIPLSIVGIILLGIVVYRYFLPLIDKLFHRLN